MVGGDPARLQQILWNLLTNAVKFTPQDGTVEVTLLNQDSSVVLHVFNSGAGIPPEFIPRLFERFSQSDSSTTRQHGGLGLGLAITRHLVELHGGSIKAENVDGGVLFVLTFPVWLAPLGSEKAPALSSVAPSEFSLEGQSSLAGTTVLVVDDDPDTLELLRHLLEQHGATVLCAKDSESCMVILQGNRPHIILCDVGMPNEDGYTLLRKIRDLSESEGGNIPAIALTAFASKDDRLTALHAGFQLHIAKPFEGSELVEAIMTLAKL